jgi:transcription initiation factor IIE alpha subunit
VDEVKTERQKVVERLEKEITKASKKKHFVESPEGSVVLEYIDQFVTDFTNQMLNTRKTHEEYIELRGKIDVLRRLRAVLSAEANEEALARLHDQLDLATSEE